MPCEVLRDRNHLHVRAWAWFVKVQALLRLWNHLACELGRHFVVLRTATGGLWVVSRRPMEMAEQVQSAYELAVWARVGTFAGL